MVAWINVAVMAASLALTVGLYVRSVRPAARSRRIGPAAWRRCARDRVLAAALLVVAAGACVVYRFHPLPMPLPPRLPWPWPISAATAALLAAAGATLIVMGIRDAGRATIRPSPDTPLFGGIYRRIRHPQSGGAMLLWAALALTLDSPFLLVLSVLSVPVWVAVCLAEQRDLALRYGDAWHARRRRTGFLLPRRRPSRTSQRPGPHRP